MKHVDAKELMSQAKFYEGYSRWVEDLERYETWNESVSRVMDMHRKFYAEKNKLTPELLEIIQSAQDSYNNKLVLGSQRALQFGGEQLLKNHMRLYNCTSSYADRAEFFGEVFWLLLCGCGTGFSVQIHHAQKIPKINNRTKQAKIHVVEDSIEGWATSLDVLMSSYFVGGGKYPEFEGRRVYFDLSKVRERGSIISGGFKAPGPEPLRKALDKIEYLLQGLVLNGQNYLKPINIYDIVMYSSDCVLAGGVRRAATICLFSKTDNEMLKAKTGNWFEENPQRARSNNSVVLKRNEITSEEFEDIMKSVKEFGEPGFYFVESYEHNTNPCFPGDIKIAIADGRNCVDIETLTKENKSFPVYSAHISPKGNWTTDIQTAVAFKTGIRKTIKITLSDSSFFECTPEHRLATPDGKYIEAKDSLNMELEGFFTYKEKSYRRINSFTNGYANQHRLIWEYHNEKINKGYVIDHIKSGSSDFIENLQILSKKEHDIKTDKERLGKNNPIHNVKDKDKWKQNLSNRTFLENNPNFNGITNEEIIENAKLLRKTGVEITINNLLKLDNRTPKAFSKNRFGGTIKNLIAIVENKIKYEKPIQKEFIPNNEKENVFSNPIVISIDIGKTVDVYDLKVENNSNFYILTSGDKDFKNSKGVLVHNCCEIGMLPYLQVGNKKISGWQGCVSYDTQLITKESIETIGKIVDLNKEIEIWNGKNWSKVKPIQTGADRELFRVKFGDGSYLDCTENHKFLVKNRFEIDFREIETRDLIDAIKNESYTLSVPRSNIKYEDGIPLSFAYEYGFLLGDGSCTMNGPTTIRLPQAEISDPKYLNPMPFVFSDKTILVEKDNYIIAKFPQLNRNFSYKLKYESGLPKELFSLNRESIKDFFAGWIDSDGTKTVSGFRIYGEKDKIRDSQLLLSKHGINSSVNIQSRKGDITNKGTRNRDVWYVQVTDPEDFYCYKFKLIKNTKKITKGKFQTIKSIEKLPGLHNSYCFEEEKLHQGVFGNVLTKQCNLVEINGSQCVTEEIFYKACEIGAILGTLQAGYTDFKFVTEETKKIFEKEALLGVSITGWMNSPKILFDEKVLRKGAQIVKETNRKIAKIIGINPAARCTTTKPSGNASVLLKTASGIHGEHSPLSLRYVQMNKDTEVAQLIKKINPHMVEESVWSSNNSDYNIAFPIIAQKGSIFKKSLKGINLLEKVKFVQNVWVEEGTNVDLCIDKTLRHNISNTVQVPKDEWDDVTKYVFENRKFFAGVSFLADTGDRDYNQAPNTEVKEEKELVKEYGAASMFASGLIVDATVGFNNLWEACMYSQMVDEYADQETLDSRKDWIRRFRNFADNYLDGDLKKTEYCLKDVYILYRWNKIQNNLVDINFKENLHEKKYTDINTMGAIACSGGSCEIV